MLVFGIYVYVLGFISVFSNTRGSHLKSYILEFVWAKEPLMSTYLSTGHLQGDVVKGSAVGAIASMDLLKLRLFLHA